MLVLWSHVPVHGLWLPTRLMHFICFFFLSNKEDLLGSKLETYSSDMRIRAFSKCSVLLVLSWLISWWDWLSVLVVSQQGLLGLLVLIVLFVLNILVFDTVLSWFLFLLLLETHAVDAAEEEGRHDGTEEWSDDVGWQVGEQTSSA